MTNEEILEIIDKNRAGTIELIKTKDYGNDIIKETKMKVELGVDYKLLVGEEEYKKKESHPLPWGHWLEGYENLVITHKDKLYLRVANAEDIDSRYIKNGSPISTDEAEKLIGASKLKSSESKVYNIKFENIKQIN